jgi:putative flippase GtrA
MMSVIHWLLAKFEKQFVIYCLIGVSGLLLDFVLFYVMIKYLDWHYQFANIISATIGITNNYWLNRNYNFKVRDRPWARFIRFFLVAFLGLFVMSGLLYILVEVYIIDEFFAKGLAVIMVALMQYYLNKRYSFASFRLACDEVSS